MARLDLPPSPHAQVFRLIERTLRNDGLFSAVVPANSFICWDGHPNSAGKLAAMPLPSVRITPAHGPEDWMFPGAMRGWMFLAVEMIVAGYDAVDVMNLWYCISRALYPANATARNTIQEQFRQAGAWTGQPLFSQPAFDATPESNYFHATGQIKIEIRLDIDP